MKQNLSHINTPLDGVHATLHNETVWRHVLWEEASLLAIVKQDRSIPARKLTETDFLNSHSDQE